MARQRRNGRAFVGKATRASKGVEPTIIATTYNTERYRPIYSHKRGLPIFLNRAS